MINKLETEVYKEECRLEVEDFMIWREKKVGIVKLTCRLQTLAQRTFDIGILAIGQFLEFWQY